MRKENSPMLDTFKGLGLLDGVGFFANFGACLYDFAKFSTTNLVDNDKISIEAPSLILR